MLLLFKLAQIGNHRTIIQTLKKAEFGFLKRAKLLFNGFLPSSILLRSKFLGQLSIEQGSDYCVIGSRSCINSINKMLSSFLLLI